MRRKSKALSNQLDFFGSAPVPAAEITAPKLKPAPRRVSGQEMKIPKPIAKPDYKLQAVDKSVILISPDEWWTTHMVCDFLKISRTTLWDRRKSAGLEFPKPAQLGRGRNLYRASAVKAWAETMAIAFRD